MKSRLLTCLMVAAVPLSGVCAEKPEPNRIYSMDEVPAEVRAIAAKMAIHQKKIVGAMDPDSLPLSDLMRRRLAALSTIAEPGLTTADKQMLASYGETEDAVLTEIGAKASARFGAICTQLNGGARADAIHDVLAMQSAEERQTAEFYQSVLTSLSEEGQRALTSYLRRVIAPRITKVTVDFAGFAAELPEQAYAQLSIACDPARRAPNASGTPGEVPGDVRFGDYGTGY
ncbi:MAG TPA: hypothetical protein VGD45_19550 [Steroidobacter sp.]|uniref:hypothetical protein n=1 Tax=Steroidobacter sp. TaxID=1978227 RepID=UPI002EDA7EE3